LKERRMIAWHKKIFEEMLVKIFPNWMKNLNHTSRSSEATGGIYTKKSRHIMRKAYCEKLLKTKNKSLEEI
jgi:hypothetical protein